MSSHDLLVWVAIADGDDVGALLDACAAANREEELLHVSLAVDSARTQLADWFGEHGSVLLSTSDTIVAKGYGVAPNLDAIPELSPTWSIGLGVDLRTAHAALAVAKVSGKNRWVDGRNWDMPTG